MDSAKPADEIAIAGDAGAPTVPIPLVSWVIPAQSRPTLVLVLMLACPLLTYQLLNLLVGLSDQFLAGWFITVKPVAYQAAQTTGNYLAWFISSYTVLVSVG